MDDRPRVDRPHEWNKGFIAALQKAMFENEVVEWSNRIQSCENGKKFRTYKLFKHSFSTEKYIACNMAKSYRSAYAKLRCG